MGDVEGKGMMQTPLSLTLAKNKLPSLPAKLVESIGQNLHTLCLFGNLLSEFPALSLPLLKVFACYFILCRAWMSQET
jgi:hypothetical protein